MEIRKCTRADFNWIHSNLALFWGDSRTQFIHHPIFVNEFSDTAIVIEKNQQIIGYLFGLFSQNNGYAYVHAVGIHKQHQRKGIGTELYDYFLTICKNQGIKKIKAITNPSNTSSIEFHQAFGFKLIGSDYIGEIPVIKNYSGINEDRVVMIKKLNTND